MTEYGFCITDKRMRNVYHRDELNHIHGEEGSAST